MRLRCGDMFDAFGAGEAAYLLATGNSYVTKEGKIVMGRGAALQLAEKHPSLPKALGDQIEHMGFYGVVMRGNLGLFQVKYHFRDKALMALIEQSADMLGGIADENPDEIFFLNFPGIGFGGLRQRRAEILEFLQKTLPQNVTVWEY